MTCTTSIFDQGDHSLDTGALIDNLHTSFVPGGCAAGAVTPPPPPSTPVVTTRPLDGTVGHRRLHLRTRSGRHLRRRATSAASTAARFAACTSGDDVDPGLLDGSHTFSSARRQRRRTGGAPATAPVSWTIARTPPAPPGVTGTPSSTTSSTPTRASPSRASPARRSPASSTAPRTPPARARWPTAAWALGTHTVLVRQTDTDGNTSTDHDRDLGRRYRRFPQAPPDHRRSLP